jgi:hypothetical protein
MQNILNAFFRSIHFESFSASPDTFCSIKWLSQKEFDTRAGYFFENSVGGRSHDYTVMKITHSVFHDFAQSYH